MIDSLSLAQEVPRLRRPKVGSGDVDGLHRGDERQYRFLGAVRHGWPTPWLCRTARAGLLELSFRRPLPLSVMACQYGRPPHAGRPSRRVSGPARPLKARDPFAPAFLPKFRYRIAVTLTSRPRGAASSASPTTGSRCHSRPAPRCVRPTRRRTRRRSARRMGRSIAWRVGPAPGVLSIRPPARETPADGEPALK
jgi:hypothetical protein